MNTSSTNSVTVESGHYGRLVFARLKPGEDLVEALEQLCASRKIGRAIVRSVVGSLVDAQLAGADREHGEPLTVPGPGVEILNAFGEIAPGDRARTSITGIVADTQARIYAGVFVRGGNRSFITIEVTLQEWIVRNCYQESVMN